MNISKRNSIALWEGGEVVMMTKKPVKVTIFLLITIIILLVSIIQASAFSYFVDVLNNTIAKEEAANFQLTIRNGGDYSDYFTISTTDVNWIVDVTPASGPVAARSDGIFNVAIRPKVNVPEGRTYFVPIKIKSEETGFYFEDTEKFALYVVSPDMRPGVYVPTVTPVVDVDKTVDPRQKVSVTVILKNRNPRELENLTVIVNGEVFYKEYSADLLALEEKTNEILFEINPLTPPGTKTLTLDLLFGGKKIGESSLDYDILGYTDLQETASKSTVLFRTVEKYIIFNNGNEPGIAEKKFSINFFERMFTKFTPDAVKEKGSDGSRYYVVRKELGSQETINIAKVTDYRVLVIIIVVILAVIILYFMLRSPVIIIKNAEPLGKTEDGVSEVKIRLYLKNRSRKPVRNLRVVDTVPSIAEIDKKTHLGSMEPVSIGKSKRGTVPRWEMDVLEAYEERIISYRIKSKLTLIGGIRLPSAKATFDAKPGKERVTYSSSINMIYKEQ